MKNKIKPYKKKSQCSEYTVKSDCYEEHKDVNLDVNMCSSSPESNAYIVSFSSCEIDKVITVNIEIDPSFYNCDCDLPTAPPKPKRRPKHIPPPTSDCIDNTIFNEDNNITNNTIIIPDDTIYEIVLDPSDIITDNDFDTDSSTPNNRSYNNITTNTSEDPIITPSSIDCNDTRSKHKNSKINKVITSSNYLDNQDNIKLNQHNNISDDIWDITNLSNNTSKSEEDNSGMDTTLILPLLSILIDSFLKYYDNNNSTENNENRHDKQDKHSKHHRSSKHHKHGKHHKHHKHHKHDKRSEHDR